MHNISSNRRYGWLPLSNYRDVPFAAVCAYLAELPLSAKPTHVCFRQRLGSAIESLALIFVLACFPSVANAMFKCVAANGTTSFQDSPCHAAVHDNSKDPVVGTKGPMPSLEVASKAPSSSQPDQMPDQMPTQELKPNMPPTGQPVRMIDAPNTGQNIDVTQTYAGGSISTGNTGATDRGKLHPGMQIFLAFSPLLIYLGIAALQGWWASARNRSFWSWFFLSLIFTPGVIFLVFLFRGRDPERPSWAR